MSNPMIIIIGDKQYAGNRKFIDITVFLSNFIELNKSLVTTAVTYVI